MVKKNISVDEGVKWMKIASIIGFVLLAYNILSFVGVGISGTAGLTADLIVSVIILLLLLVFYFGFVELGKKTGSKSLVFSSWAIIISIVLFIILAIIAYFIIQPYFSMFSPNGAENIQTDSLMGVFGVLIVIFILIFLFFIVVSYIFYIGLLGIKDRVRMAKWAGIVGLVTISVLILFAFYFVYITMSGILTQAMLLVLSGQSSGVISFLEAAGIILPLLIFAALLFESLTLLEGSKKFE